MSSSKIKNIQRVNLLLENRYLTEGNVTIEQLLQNKTLKLFKRIDTPGEIIFEHTLENPFKKGEFYKNISITFTMGGYKNKSVQIMVFCENPSFVDIVKKITEKLQQFKDAGETYLVDDSEGKTKNTFGYEFSKIISVEDADRVFESIKAITDYSDIENKDEDLFIKNPEWVK